MHYFFHSLLILFLLAMASGCGSTTTDSEFLIDTNTTDNPSATSSQESNESSSNTTTDTTAVGTEANSSLTTKDTNSSMEAFDFKSSVEKIEVNSALEEHKIDFYVVDKAGYPVANKSVYVKFFTQGSINSYELQSDSSGIVSFTYKAPASLEDVTNFTLLFSLEKSTTQELGVEVLFAQIDPVITLQNSVITLTEDTQQEDVVLFLFRDNKLFNGSPIFVKYPDINTSYEGGVFKEQKVDVVDGMALFHFIGPQKLKSIDDTVFSFYQENNQTKEVNLTVKYRPKTDAVQIISEITTDGNLTITDAKQKVSVVLSVKDSFGGLIRSGTINVQGFNAKYGTFTKNSIDVVDGVAVFEYQAPDDLSALTSYNFLFLDSASDRSTPWRVTFTPTPTEELNVSLSVSDSNITIERGSENVNIVISAFDENNYTVNGGSVVVQYPASFINENLGGTFQKNEVNIEEGRAKFVFEGPEILERSNSIYNFKFFYKKSGQTTDINKSVGIEYKPELPIIILSKHEINATINSQTFTVDVQVLNRDNTPYYGGTVNVVYPDEVLQSIDVGVMSDFNKSIENGVASFVYTAPRNLKDLNVTAMTFKFYHSSSISTAKNFTINIDPAENQVVTTTYDVVMNLSDNSVSMGLESSKILTFSLSDEDGNLLEDSNITEFNITVLNSALGLINNSIYSDETNISDENNSVSVTLKTKTKSGVIPLRADVRFKDLNNEEKTISKVFNVVVLSGPPTAMSITYAGTTQDKEYAKFEEHLVLTVVDKYFNPVNTSPAVHVGAIVGYATDGDGNGVGNNYLFVEPDQVKAATLNPDDGGSVTLTSGAANTFANLDENNDVVAVFAKGYNYNASGKWDFIPNANNKITLVDQFDGNSSVPVTNLGYAVGHNQREDICNPGTSYVGNVVVDGDQPILDSLGRAKLTLSYDYYLTGKNVVVWVNLVGYQADIGKITKVGTAKKIFLRGSGFEGSESITYGKGNSGTISIIPQIKGTGEFLRNSYFGVTISNTGTASFTKIYDSRDDIYDCGGSNGIAKVTYSYTNSDVNATAGTLSLSIDPNIYAEF